MTNRSLTNAYALYKSKNLLHFIETQQPRMNEAIQADGKIYCSFFHEQGIEKYEKKGFLVQLADIEEEIKRLRKSIDYYENLEK